MYQWLGLRCLLLWELRQVFTPFIFQFFHLCNEDDSVYGIDFRGMFHEKMQIKHVPLWLEYIKYLVNFALLCSNCNHLNLLSEVIHKIKKDSSSFDDWINKMCSIFTMEYLAIERYKALIHTTTCMNLENIVLSKRSQLQKVAEGWWEEGGELIAKWFCFCDDKNVLKLTVVMDASPHSLYEYIKNHQIAQFQCMICESLQLVHRY